VKIAEQGGPRRHWNINFDPRAIPKFRFRE
jgi:hypothetical protein